MRKTFIALLTAILVTGALPANAGGDRDHLLITVPLESTAQFETIATRAPQHALMIAGGVRIPDPRETDRREAALSSVLDVGPREARRLLATPAFHRRADESAAAYGSRMLDGPLADAERLERGSFVTRARVERLLTGQVLVSLSSAYEATPGGAAMPTGPVTRLLLEPDSPGVNCPYPVDASGGRNLYALRGVSFEARES